MNRTFLLEIVRWIEYIVLLTHLLLTFSIRFAKQHAMQTSQTDRDSEWKWFNWRYYLRMNFERFDENRWSIKMRGNEFGLNSKSWPIVVCLEMCSLETETQLAIGPFKRFAMRRTGGQMAITKRRRKKLIQETQETHIHNTHLSICEIIGLLFQILIFYLRLCRWIWFNAGKRQYTVNLYRFRSANAFSFRLGAWKRNEAKKLLSK